MLRAWSLGLGWDETGDGGTGGLGDWQSVSIFSELPAPKNFTENLNIEREMGNI